MADEEAVEAPAPVVEVEMSVLDALKEVSDVAATKSVFSPNSLAACFLFFSIAFIYHSGSSKGHDPWWAQEGPS